MNLTVGPQIPQDLFTQFVCSSPKFWDFNEKRLHWVYVVRAQSDNISTHCASYSTSSIVYTMALLVMEFQDQGYKIRNIFAQKSTYPKENVEY